MNSRGDIINSPIESRHPVEVASAFGKGLDARQQGILNMLPGYGSETIVRKRDVSMLDLAAMTASTGDEFAMFTKGGERLLVRGGLQHGIHGVPINPERAARLKAQGYRWSGHTHPETNIMPSGGDRAVLEAFEQSQSVIYNPYGRFVRFGRNL